MPHISSQSLLHWSIPIIGLLVLPLLPVVGYVPLALPIGGLLMLWMAWSTYRFSRERPEKITKSSGDTGNHFTLAGTGFGMILVPLLLGSMITLFQKGISALTFGVPLLILTTCFYFILTRNRKVIIPENSLTWLGMGVVVFWSVWVAVHAVGSSFEELTHQLSYSNGVANVSQIAMYAGMAGLIVFSRSGSKTWQWVVVGGLLLILAWLLDSKLLMGAAALGILSRILRSQPLKVRRWITGGLGLSALGGVIVLQPSSLAGRVETLRVALQGIDWKMPFGTGPGGMEDLMNQLFFNGKVENTIGEIGPIAFNDYLQILVEIGPFGLLGMFLISVSILGGSRPLLALAWIGITWVMFPLQFIESAVLWVLVVYCLENRSLNWAPLNTRASGRFRIYQPQLPSTRIVIPILISSAFLFMVYQSTVNLLLFRADQRIEAHGISKYSQSYESLQPYFVWTPEFHLKWGQHLQQADRHNEALPHFRMAAGLTPSYTALTHLGDACFTQGLFEEAELRYNQAHLLRPKRLYPQYRKVFCLLQNENDQEAKELASELTREFANPNDPYQATMVRELSTKVLGINSQDLSLL